LTQPSWEGPSLDVDDQARDAALGCVRVSSFLRRIGLDSSWRFMPGDGTAFGMARVLLRGGDIEAEVGFEGDDLAAAATDQSAVNELAGQAVAVWRARHL
jgi:hypothetical protein